MDNYAQVYRDTCEIVLNEIKSALLKVEPAQVEQLAEMILKAEQVFVVGVGRVLLSLEAWVKRFAQMGIKIYFVGEVAEPAITEKDLLIVGSGSGNSLFPSAIAKKAKEYHAKVVHIGSNPRGEVSPYVDVMVRIPVQTKLYLEDEIPSEQPMTSLFEQSLYILGDVIAKILIDRRGIDMKSLWQYHANLE